MAMKKYFYLILLTSVIFSCNRRQKKIKFQGYAEGTYYAVTYFSKDGINYQNEIIKLLNDFENSASIYRKNSLISKINNNDTNIILDKTLNDIINKSIQISKETNGAFDITVSPLVNAWGFGYTDTSTISKPLIDSLLNYVGYNKIHIINNKLLKDNKNIKLDLNAIAKGYSVDLVGNFLKSKGINNFIIDIGGEVKANGTKSQGKAWEIGIEKPCKTMYDDREIKSKIILKDKAIATSGNYRKFYIKNGVKYSHTIDPKTGYPVSHSLLSASVISDKCMTADAYATAFMVMGLEKAKLFIEKHQNIEAYFIYSDAKNNMKVYSTKGFSKLLREN